MFYVVLHILVPIMLIFYGYKLRFKTPPFSENGKGINTWRTRESKREWDLGNKFGGLVCMIEGAVLGVVCAVKLLVWGPTDYMIYNYAYAGVAIVAMLTLVPIVHAYLNRSVGPGSDKFHDRLRR